MVKESLQKERQQRVAQLRAQGTKGTDAELLEEVNRRFPPPETFQWCLPGAMPFVEVLSPRMIKFMLLDNFEGFIKGPMQQAEYFELLADSSVQKTTHTHRRGLCPKLPLAN
jgi:hypothetical protein